jgi:methylmalonyl-CoA mutase C-terminal domain/subunit
LANPIRVLVAKPGLDGHDRGALVVAQGLRDEGMEVIYTGLRQTPDQIAAVAVQEDVACVGLSSLSGAHMDLFPEVVQALRARGAGDILVIGGGVIPEQDIPLLKQSGIAEIFTPGSSIHGMAEYIRQHVAKASVLPPLTGRIDHIGIAVDSIAKSIAFYTEHLGLPLVHEETIPDDHVKVAFLQAGETFLELLEPLSEASAVATFLKKRGPGMHHIAYEVDSVEEALLRAQNAGYRLLDEKPRRGGHGKLIGFVHPAASNGVLTEYCQRIKEHAQ